MSDADTGHLLGPPRPSAQADAMLDLADYIVNWLFSIGLRLETARGTVRDGPAGDQVKAVADEAEHMIRDIRKTVFDLAENRQAPLQGRLTRAARASQLNALDTVALLEQQAELLRPPTRLDYPAEIKRWRGLADQAGKIADRWEQRP